MQRLAIIIRLTLLALAGLASPCLQAQGFADAAVEAQYDDNLGRFIRNGASDTGLAALLAGGYHWQPGLYTSFTLTAALRQTLWRQYSGMSSLASSAGAELSHKFGIGDLRPVVKAGVQAEQQNFRNDVRDATLTTVYVAAGKRVTQQLSLELRLARERSDGDQDAPPADDGHAGRPTVKPKSGKVWDFSVNTLRIGAEYELGASAWLGATYQFRDGPVVATAAVYSQPNPAALASTYDPVFGRMLLAYRLDARTRIFSIDYNRAVFDRATVYAGFEFQHSTASSGVDYEVRLLRAGFIHGF